VDNLYQELLAFVMTFLSIAIIGHRFVKADCSRFAPTNAVNQSQWGLTNLANAKLNRTKKPAMPLKYLSIMYPPLKAIS